MLRTVFTPPPDMRLDNIASVEKRHLSIRLDPDLVSCMRRNDIESSDVDSELARLRELADACS